MEIIKNGKVYFRSFLGKEFGNLGNFEKSIFKKVGKKIERGVKKAIKKPLKSTLGIVGSAVSVYFGLPALASVGSKVGSGISVLGNKLLQTKTGMWWLNTGDKILRVFKSKKGKIITQEIPKNQIPNSDKIPESIPLTESQVKDIIKITPPFILPSGIDVDEYNQLKSKNIDLIGIEKEYSESGSVDVKIEDGKAKIIKDNKILPLVLLGIGGLYIIYRKGKKYGENN